MLDLDILKRSNSYLVNFDNFVLIIKKNTKEKLGEIMIYYGGGLVFHEQVPIYKLYNYSLNINDFIQFVENHYMRATTEHRNDILNSLRQHHKQIQPYFFV